MIGSLALQSALPPFATDMYTPALPRVVADLDTTAAAVGLTLTAFFIGMALGQLVGGPVSDQRGRRAPMVVGGILCTLGAIGCVVAPSIGTLIAARLLSGFGGGIAAVVARAVIVDITSGDQLARLMSVMMAIGGLAPMIAPVTGGAVLTLGGTWRTVFGVLVLLGLLMTATAAFIIPESLPAEHRHGGGVRTFVRDWAELVRIRPFIGYMLTNAFSGFAMFAYISNSSYVLQSMKGMRPMSFAVFFAATAFSQVLLSLLNARIVTRYGQHRLITLGMSMSSLAVIGLTIGVFLFDTPLVWTAICFLVMMAVQAFVFGNAGALASSQAVHIAGSASAMLGVVQAMASSISAPLASAGGSTTAAPMGGVMISGMAMAWVAYLGIARGGRAGLTPGRA
ncbi:Bcr/CflA family efflux MFS transporter [Aestuariimicrobium ganziense]|uniref:Bcr/CflA family efflux MFS transporter n=1 Tax=Aestuariimicrobium ganziense TaxID=2773677 RepID=UPI00194192A7|nr:Bcr/CflA family efflux MFS transporter [Aestuariimicrobium ganziense]